MKKVILLLGVIVAFSVVAFLVVRSGESNDGNLRFYGNVDLRDVSLGFRVPGRLSTMLVEEGDKVQAGQTLARLDDAPDLQELAEAQARLAAAEAREQLLEKGYRAEEISQAQAIVAEREATFTNAQRLLKRQRDLAGTKAVAQQTVD